MKHLLTILVYTKNRKRAYNKGYGKNAVASYSVCTKSHLELCKLHHLVYGSRESVDVLAASLSEVRLTAATALDELGSLAHHLTGVERVVFHEVVAHADVEHRLLVSYRAYNSEQVRRNSLTQLEHEVLGSSRLQREDSCDDLHAVLTSSLKKHAFYNLLINNILYLCVT